MPMKIQIEKVRTIVLTEREALIIRDAFGCIDCEFTAEHIIAGANYSNSSCVDSLAVEINDIAMSLTKLLIK